MKVWLREHVTTWAVPGGRGAPRAVRFAHLGLFAIGALLVLVPVVSVTGSWALAAAGAIALTLVRAAGALVDHPRRALRVLAWTAVALAAGLHLLALYQVVAWGTLLGWTTPLWARAGAAIVLAAALAPRAARAVPVILPAGIVIAACLAGWLREESVLRCDDLARIEPPVEVVVPTRRDADACRPGEVLSVRRYPRRSWESPDGRRILFTSQAGGEESPAPDPDGTVTGIVCESPAEGTRSPRCVGGAFGKSQQMLEVPSHDRLYVGAWGVLQPDGRPGSVILALPRDRPLEILDAHYFDRQIAGSMFYVPGTDTFWLVSEDRPLQPFRGRDFVPGRASSYFAEPGELHYDAEHDEGLMCGGIPVLMGGTGAVAAFHGDPFSVRALMPDGLLALASVSWGCDWGESRDVVYTTIPNLGLLAVLDARRRTVERLEWIGLGMRSLEHDRARRRIYVTNFLAGEVVALDAETGGVVDRWFVGRFAREVHLTRDGRALLVGSTAGLVRIRLGDP